MPSPPRIRPPRSPRRFLAAQRAFYRGDPDYVPPIVATEAWQVDPRRNPFFTRAEADFALAERDGRVTGRISAVRNAVHDEFHGDRVGFFGHFEATDRESATALLDHAAGWLAARGATSIRGPIDLSTNYRCGLRIAGEPGPPVMMMPHNPPHYAAWLEHWGLAKVKDVVALMMNSAECDVTRFDRLAGRIAQRTGARIRPVQLRRFDTEIDTVWRLYHRIWEKNWGFVPMLEDEFRRSARDMVHIAHRDLLVFVEVEDEPVAFAVCLPDANAGARACGGRLWPLGWWRFLRAIKATPRARVLTLGVVPEHRKTGLDVLLLRYLFYTAPGVGYPLVEASWILEDNHRMLSVLDTLGGREYQRYRIFERAL